MFEEILKASGGKLLIPVVIAVVFAAIVKALFEVRRSKLGERKDFLEIWAQQRLQDDLWLEVTIRHLIGSYLPALVIRKLFEQRGQVHLHPFEPETSRSVRRPDAGKALSLRFDHGAEVVSTQGALLLEIGSDGR